MSKPRPPINPRELMEKALQLIEGEIKHLKDASKLGKLDPENTTALIRYSDAIVKYVKDGLKIKEEEEKTVSKMSTEELAELAAKAAAKAKK